MHEVSLVAALVDQIEDVAQREGFERVLEIRMGVGALSGVDPSCLEFCFPEVTRDSVLEGAKLILEFVEIELYCKKCGQISCPEDPGAIFCMHCQVGDVVVNKGREFRVLDLEVI